MKRRTFFCLLTLFFLNYGYGQKDSIIKEQKGLLFISAYNYQYDVSGGHMYPVGFHDYFFPCKFFDSRLLSDSNLSVIFKTGLRVNAFKGRNKLKLSAKRFEVKDSSGCYDEREFYVIPVMITYKMREDSWPVVCEKSFLDLSIKEGANVQFIFLRKEIEISKIFGLNNFLL